MLVASRQEAITRLIAHVAPPRLPIDATVDSARVLKPGHCQWCTEAATANSSVTTACGRIAGGNMCCADTMGGREDPVGDPKGQPKAQVRCDCDLGHPHWLAERGLGFFRPRRTKEAHHAPHFAPAGPRDNAYHRGRPRSWFLIAAGCSQ